MFIGGDEVSAAYRDSHERTSLTLDIFFRFLGKQGVSRWRVRCNLRQHSDAKGACFVDVSRHPSETLRRTWASCLAAIGADVPTPARDGDISCRQLFDVLDGRVILAANQSWQVRVYAVVDDGASRWVQMTVGGRDALRCDSPPRVW
jgi:hypothetical protein